MYLFSMLYHCLPHDCVIGNNEKGKCLMLQQHTITCPFSKKRLYHFLFFVLSSPFIYISFFHFSAFVFLLLTYPWKLLHIPNGICALAWGNTGRGCCVPCAGEGAVNRNKTSIENNTCLKNNFMTPLCHWRKSRKVVIHTFLPNKFIPITVSIFTKETSFFVCLIFVLL